MACVGFVTEIVPAPLVGTPYVLPFEIIENQHCVVHFNGLITGCGVKGNRGEVGICCLLGDDKGFEVPLLGYNTTPSVFVECDSGAVPTLPQRDDLTLPTSTATQTTGISPTPTTPTSISGASKNKINIGIAFLLAVFVAVS